MKTWCICDSCTIICKNILDREFGVALAPVEDIQQRLKLLHDLLETKDITPKEYDKKVKQVVARI